MGSLTEPFCLIDDFCREFEPAFEQRQLESGTRKRHTTTGEFVNVGVALFSPEACYAGALCRGTSGRRQFVHQKERGLPALGVNPQQLFRQIRRFKQNFRPVSLLEGGKFEKITEKSFKGRLG